MNNFICPCCSKEIKGGCQGTVREGKIYHPNCMRDSFIVTPDDSQYKKVVTMSENKNNKCTCKHIAIGMECLKCGYPYCEAGVGDDGTDCTCTSPDCGVCGSCKNHRAYCTCKESSTPRVFGKRYRLLDRNEVIEEGAMQSWDGGELHPITNFDGKTVGDHPYNFSIERDFYNPVCG